MQAGDGEPPRLSPLAGSDAPSAAAAAPGVETDIWRPIEDAARLAVAGDLTLEELGRLRFMLFDALEAVAREQRRRRELESPDFDVSVTAL